MLEETRKRLPALSSWAEAAYGGSAYRYFRGRRFVCSTGTIQGDPVAGILFGIALLPTQERISREVPTLLANTWIHDDGTICGSIRDLPKVIKILEEESKPLGLTLCKHKCQVWVGDHDPTNTDLLGCGIPRAQSEGFNLLGSPIGTPKFMASTLNERIDRIEDTITNKLPLLEDPQLQLCLLCSTQALPKLVYSLRTCKTENINSALMRFDHLQKCALEEIIGAPLTSIAVAQASLPVSKGGLGLRKATLHSRAAYLSSSVQSKAIVDKILQAFPHRRPLQEALASFLATAGPLTPETEADLTTLQSNHFTQSKLSHHIDSNLQTTLLNRAIGDKDARTKARLQSLTLNHAGDYLNSVPSHFFGL